METPESNRTSSKNNTSTHSSEGASMNVSQNAFAVIAVVRLTHVLLPLTATQLMIGPAELMNPSDIMKRLPEFWEIKKVDTFMVPVKELIRTLKTFQVFSQTPNG